MMFLPVELLPSSLSLVCVCVMLLTLLSEQCVVSGVHGAVADGADDGVMSRLVTVAGRDDVHRSLLSPRLTHLSHTSL